MKISNFPIYDFSNKNYPEDTEKLYDLDLVIEKVPLREGEMDGPLSLRDCSYSCNGLCKL